MKAQTAGKAERLAKTSLILGILSAGFLLLTVLLAIWIRYSGFDEFRKLALLGWVGLSFLVNLITGISGCVVAIIALRRNKEEGGNPNIKRIASTGLILSCLGSVVVCSFLAFVFLFNTPTPPPVITTPSPLIP